MSDTLVLNADGMPLSIVPLSTLTWQEAIKLIFVDRVDVLEHYEDWKVNSPSVSFKVPSVVILRDYIRVDRSVKFSRQNLLLRDNYTCQYCDMNASHDHSLLTADHVIPRYHGGKTNWDNIVAACQSCNLEKAHFMKMKPKIPPRKPTYYELVNKARKFPIHIPHAIWADFLGWPPELVRIRENTKKSGLILEGV